MHNVHNLNRDLRSTPTLRIILEISRGIDESRAFSPPADTEAEHLREIRKLDDIAYRLLRGAVGDHSVAEKSLDNVIDTLFEDGALSMWRYRIVLTKIHEGL